MKKESNKIESRKINLSLISTQTANRNLQQDLFNPMVNPVLKSAYYVLNQSKHVQTDSAAIGRLARSLLTATVPKWNYQYHFYDGSARTIAYLLLLDALNFCFFREPRWRISYCSESLTGYFALAAALKRGLEEEIPLDNFSFLAAIDHKILSYILRGENEIPLLEERLAIIRELGTGMITHYQGDVRKLITAAGGSALKLVHLLVKTFPGFRDESLYKEQTVCFYKRAQIFAADLYGSFHGKEWGEFSDITLLTAFADYKIPQILRHQRALTYSDKLATLIDEKQEITAGSAMEIEIRAGTICAIEMLRRELALLGRDIMSIEIDWILWNQARNTKMAPHHRTITTFY